MRYGPREKNQALVQVTGADSEIDDKILLASTAATQKDTRYTAQLRSKHHEASLLSENTGSMPMPCATHCIVRTPQHASLRRTLLHAIARSAMPGALTSLVIH